MKTPILSLSPELHPRSFKFQRRTVRGVATLEAALFLPVLILVFAGLWFVIRQSRAQAEARSQARSCAWRISASGCTVTPPDCSSDNASDETSASGRERLDNAHVFDGMQGSPAAAKEIENRLDGLLVERNTSVVKVPYTRFAILSPQHNAAGSSNPLPDAPQTEAPTDEQLIATAEYRLPCNSMPLDKKNLVRALFDEIAP